MMYSRPVCSQLSRVSAIIASASERFCMSDVECFLHGGDAAITTGLILATCAKKAARSAASDTSKEPTPNISSNATWCSMSVPKGIPPALLTPYASAPPAAYGW